MMRTPPRTTTTRLMAARSASTSDVDTPADNMEPTSASAENIKKILNEIEKLQKMCALTNEVVVKLQATVQKMLSDNKTVHGQISENIKNVNGLVTMSENNNAVLNGIKDSITISNAKSLNQPEEATYSGVVKNPPIIIVKPKDTSQSCSVTKDDMRKNIDPTGLPICGVRNVSKGGIIIECTNKIASLSLQNDVAKKLGSNYKVDIPGKRNPKVRITGLSEELPPDLIINKMLAQNHDIFSSESVVKVLHTFNLKRSYGIKLELDPTSFLKIMVTQKIRIDWDICSVEESFDLMRCFNCSDFHHTAKKCTSKMVCPRCTQEHKLADCPSTSETCNNCKLAATNLKMSLDTCHSAWSRKCPVYLRKISVEKRLVDYGQD